VAGALLDADAAMAKATGEVITIGGQVHQDRSDACEAMNALLERHLPPGS
jgi:hypothetical protein